MVTLDNFRILLLIGLIAVFAVNPTFAAKCLNDKNEDADCDGANDHCEINGQGNPAGCTEQAKCPTMDKTDGTIQCDGTHCCCKAQDDASCNDPQKSGNKDIICKDDALKATASMCASGGTDNTGGSGGGGGGGGGGGASGGPMTCSNNATAADETCTDGKVCLSDLKGVPMGCEDPKKCSPTKKITKDVARCNVNKGICCCISSGNKPCNKANGTDSAALMRALPTERSGAERTLFNGFALLTVPVTMIVTALNK